MVRSATQPCRTRNSVPAAVPALPAVGDTAVQVRRPASAPGWNDAALALTVVLRCARERVRIATPYARLPRWLRDLLVATARRGVDVELLVSGPYVPSTGRGRRWERSTSTGGRWTWNEQVCLLLHDPAVVATLDAHYDEDLGSSRPVDPADWRGAGFGGARRRLRRRRPPAVGWQAAGLIGRRPW